MVEAFQKCWRNPSSFTTGSIDRSGYLTFTVHHFDGPVTYSSENFLERSQHELNSDFVSLLRGGAGDAGAVGVGSGGGETGGSINPFVKGLFSGKAIGMQDNEAATKPGGCITGEFRAAFDTLFETLNEAQAWQVFCIDPNDSQLLSYLEGRSVKGQVRSFGLAEIAKRSGVVFEVNVTPDEFCERYGEGMAEVGVTEGMEKERVQQVRTVFELESMDTVLGNQQVMFLLSAKRFTNSFVGRTSRKRPSIFLKINYVHGTSGSRSATECGTQRQRQDSVLVPSLTLMLSTTLPVSTHRRPQIVDLPNSACMQYD
ncbi:hypothetical protein PQX77_003517 [Marasmius sp. AFHP31]|nr:hypothetical protein PQX77_003517 [Marasmius sp. AFHP31]